MGIGDVRNCDERRNILSLPEYARSHGLINEGEPLEQDRNDLGVDGDLPCVGRKQPNLEGIGDVRDRGVRQRSGVEGKPSNQGSPSPPLWEHEIFRSRWNWLWRLP